jgi:hypothetical protein
LIDIESAEDEPEIAKVRDFFVTVTGGLEDVALREIKASLKGVTRVQVHRRQRQGRIHFRYDRSPKHLLALESVEGVFALLSEFDGVTTGRPGLFRVADAISTVDLAPGVVLYNILHGVPATSGLAVSCTVGRGHRFSSSELHQVLRTVLAQTYDLDEEEQHGPYSLQVRIEGRRGVVGFRLSGRSLMEGSLGEGGGRSVSGDLSVPAIRAIGMVIQPERRGTWLDPICRGGVALAVFAERYGIRPVGLETQQEWAEVARKTLGHLPQSSVGLWDGQRIPFVEGTFNGIFGYLGRRAEISFGPELQSEFERVLTEYGRAILLCERDRDLESGFDSGLSPFRCVDRRPIQVGGDSLCLYQLRKVPR